MSRITRFLTSFSCLDVVIGVDFVACCWLVCGLCDVILQGLFVIDLLPHIQEAIGKVTEARAGQGGGVNDRVGGNALRVYCGASSVFYVFARNLRGLCAVDDGVLNRWRSWWVQVL